MSFAKLIETLTERGLSVVRIDGDRLRCRGDLSQLTPDLQAGLKEHRDAFLSLLPSPRERCEQIVSDAVDAANAVGRPTWTPTEANWEAMDEFQDKMHHAARAGDIDGTEAAAAEYVRVAETCRLADKIHEWKPGTESSSGD